MRSVNRIVVHCAASLPHQDIGAAEIREWHLGRGFSDIGYHFVIRLDGETEAGRKLNEVGAHAQGHNADSIGICLVGGLDKNGKASNTFSREQFATLAQLIGELRDIYPKAEVLGHRDLPNVKKDCPCFDVRGWCAQRGIDPTP